MPVNATDPLGQDVGYPVPPGFCGPPAPCPPNPDAGKPGYYICGYIQDPRSGQPCPIYCPPKVKTKKPFFHWPWEPQPKPPEDKPKAPPRFKDCLTEDTVEQCESCCGQYGKDYSQYQNCIDRCRAKKWPKKD